MTVPTDAKEGALITMMSNGPEVKVLFGKRLTPEDRPPQCSNKKDIMLSFISDNEDIMDVTESQLSKHTLLIGGIGSGKTNCFNFIVSGLNCMMTSKDVMLIFDKVLWFSFSKQLIRAFNIFIPFSAIFLSSRVCPSL